MAKGRMEVDTKQMVKDKETVVEASRANGRWDMAEVRKVVKDLLGMELLQVRMFRSLSVMGVSQHNLKDQLGTEEVIPTLGPLGPMEEFLQAGLEIVR